MPKAVEDAYQLNITCQRLDSEGQGNVFGRLGFATCHCIHNVLAKRLQETLNSWGYTVNAVRVVGPCEQGAQEAQE